MLKMGDINHSNLTSIIESLINKTLPLKGVIIFMKGCYSFIECVLSVQGCTRHWVCKAHSKAFH